MRRQVEHYTGHKITKKVLKRINLIDLKRIQEGINKFSMDEVYTLQELCTIHETEPKDEHIILGEDWYIVYTVTDDTEIEIKDWVAINSVENKFAQTMEMYIALKKILLDNENKDIHCILRHSTSYPFYKKLLEQGYINEIYDIATFEDDSEEEEKIKHKIYEKYDSIDDYLLDENRERYEGYSIEDIIYHEVCFNITKSFSDKYKRSGR